VKDLGEGYPARSDHDRDSVERQRGVAARAIAVIRQPVECRARGEISEGILLAGRANRWYGTGVVATKPTFLRCVGSEMSYTVTPGPNVPPM
jgi:hypothetical protein